MAEGKIGNVQALRAVAVLLVVGRHIQVYMERAAGGQPWLGSFWIGDMGVDLFFVISGCVLTINHEAEIFARGASAARFFYRRVTRIYPLYWFYSLLALSIYLYRPDWLHRLSQGTPIHLLPSLLLWPQVGWPLLGQAWSLVYEMWFYLLFAGWMLLPKEKRLTGLLILAGVVTAGGTLLAARPALATPEGEVVFSLLTLEFIGGMLVGLAVRQLRTTGKAQWGALLLASSAGWIACLTLPLGMPSSGAARIIEYGLPSIAVVYGVLWLENAGCRAPRWLVVIGNWSYSIFLSHIFVIASLVRLLPPVWASDATREIALAAALVAATLLIGATSYYCLERPLARLTRRRSVAETRSEAAFPCSRDAGDRREDDAPISASAQRESKLLRAVG